VRRGLFTPILGVVLFMVIMPFLGVVCFGRDGHVAVENLNHSAFDTSDERANVSVARQAKHHGGCIDVSPATCLARSREHTAPAWAMLAAGVQILPDVLVLSVDRHTTGPLALLDEPGASRSGTVLRI